MLDASMNVVDDSSIAKYTRTCQFKDEVYHVLVAHMDKSPKFTGRYMDANLETGDGEFSYYFQNGQKESQGEFVNGVKSGVWKRWDWTGTAKTDRYYPGISVNQIRKKHETEPAHFPGGEEAMWAFIRDNLEYPEQARKQSFEGEVEIAFNIDSLGFIKNIQITESAHYFLDKEAFRLIWMMPQWEPAKRRGIPVESKFIMPLLFRLAPLRKAN